MPRVSEGIYRSAVDFWCENCGLNPMHDYTQLSDSELIELLAAFTTKYTHLLTLDSGGDAQQECKNVLDALVDEVYRRKINN